MPGSRRGNAVNVAVPSRSSAVSSHTAETARTHWDGVWLRWLAYIQIICWMAAARPSSVFRNQDLRFRGGDTTMKGVDLLGRSAVGKIDADHAPAEFVPILHAETPDNSVSRLLDVARDNQAIRPSPTTGRGEFLHRCAKGVRVFGSIE